MRIRLLAAACLLLMTACGQRKTAPPVFPVPAQMTLYSIKADLVPHSESAYQATNIEVLPMLGKTEITDAKVRQEIIDALNKALSNKEFVESCFNPRHGIRAIDGASQTDYIICFECGSMHVLVDGKRKAYTIDSSAQEILNKILRAANVPLNKSH